jgi:branched-chain amino acid transport system substrate-binding protein
VLESYFKMVNDAGGVYGEKTELIILDDRYEPMLTVQNAEKLINEDHVLALVSVFGGSNTNAILSIVDKAQIPLVGPITSTDLRDAVRPEVFITHLENNKLVYHVGK